MNAIMMRKHYFEHIGETPEETYEVSSVADTPETAATKLSGSPSEWRYLRTEEKPYLYGEVAYAVAQLLPGKWIATVTFPEYHNSAMHLTREADGLQLWLHADNGNGQRKYRISLAARMSKGRVITPADHTGRCVSCAVVGVSASKTPEQIAKDITRRLLSEAEDVDKCALATIARQNDARSKMLDTGRAISEALGVKWIEPRDGNCESLYIHSDVCSATVTLGGSAKLEPWSVEGADKAAKLATAIREALQ